MSAEELVKKFEKKIIEASGPDWEFTVYVMEMDELAKVTSYLRRILKMENKDGKR